LTATAERQLEEADGSLHAVTLQPGSDVTFGLSRYFPIAYWTLLPFIALVLAGTALVAAARGNAAVAGELALLLAACFWAMRLIALNVWRVSLLQHRLEIRYLTTHSERIAWSDIASIRICPAKPPGVVEIEVVRRNGRRTAFKISRAYGSTERLQQELAARVKNTTVGSRER
jgi:hypothetical protein